MIRRVTLITYLGVYLFAIATVVRVLSILQGEPYPGIVVGLFVVFFVLLVIEPWLSRRSRLYTHIYFAVQTGIVMALAILPPVNDFFASLFFSLILQAMYVLPARMGFRWVGGFAIIMAVFMLHIYGLAGLPLILIYAAGYLFMGSYAAFIRQAETTNEDSEKILDELKTAHQQLKVYAAQAEELAVVQERNRLARNLHDSVTQTIFSMTLSAESARILFERDKSRAEAQLEKLQGLAKSALAEIRSLIFELQPAAITNQEFIPALREHVSTIERQHGMLVALRVVGEPHLSDEQAQRLFRVIQEALYNVIKHALVNEASVNLLFEQDRIFVEVEDHGRGFTPVDIPPEDKHMGLSSMRHRVDIMGGSLSISSQPGEGTTVTIEISTGNGDKDDG
jgi:signal transduction histidine kinase